MSGGANRVIYPDRYLVVPDWVVRKKASAAYDPTLFEALVDSNLGYDLLWSRAVLCTCRSNAQTEQPNPACPICHGDGWRYVHPHPELFREDCAADGTIPWDSGERIRGLISGVHAQRKQEQEPIGTTFPGEARLTVRGDVKIGMWDRLIMVDALMPYDQVLVRSGDRVEVGRDNRYNLRYPVADVLDIRDISTRYRERTHWTVEDGEIVWVAGEGPAEGARFSIRYRMHPRWIVTDMPRTVIGYKQPTKQTGLQSPKYRDLPLHCTISLDFRVF